MSAVMLGKSLISMVSVAAFVAEFWTRKVFALVFVPTTCAVPSTSRFVAGFAVPIPTLPFESAVRTGDEFATVKSEPATFVEVPIVTAPEDATRSAVLPLFSNSRK